MKNNLTKLFLIAGVLGVYSASMYTMATTASQPNMMRVPTHSDEDVQKILDVVKVQSASQEAMYVPGVACVIEATEQMSVEEMELLFKACADSHSEHLQTVDFDK
ncbi:MAG TPA: hypothetical protein EYQ00_05255 [Dehalococcoidia bacterium]|jgi:hypothetical protein|nr:hypothetical protein [Dehalococcoidia bacterium]